MLQKPIFSQQTRMPLSAKELFDWHTRPGAFERLSPPWVDMEIAKRTGGIENGAQVVLKIKQGPASLMWRLAHKDFEPGHQFKDYQITGPFAFWEQTHACEPIDSSSSFLKDVVQFELPLSMVSHTLGVPMIEHELRRLFKYRHRLMVKDCETIKANEANTPESTAKKKRIVVTGSTGMVGRHLIPYLWTQNCEVVRLIRPSSDKGEVVHVEPGPEPTASWDPAAGTIDANALEGAHAVVHLSGDNVAQGRWTEEKKERLRRSRIDSTRLLVDTICRMKNPPGVFICASAIGYYGDGKDKLLDESSPMGKGFLALLCEEWEAVTKPLEAKGVRVVNIRIGVIMSPRGGALAAMLPIFQVGGGGPLGDGKQYLSWISPDDIDAAILHCINTDSLHGPVNFTAPNPVQNKVFADTLGHVLARPAFMPAPAPAIRLILGEFAEEALLAGARVIPKKLIDSGYVFRDPDLETALRSQLGAL
jgi:uncharacterized protein (TIGR01777 family)